jgi:iron complex transport system ATP-binding protein
MAPVENQPVVEIRDVDVVRGQARLLRAVDWTVQDDERWVMLGPNGAGKTTLLQLASAQMHPSSGEVRILGETLGAVDVFELRPRIGLTSAALAQRISPAERVGDVVVSAGYAVVGRWRERYDVHDLTRAAMLMQQWGVAPMAHRPFGTLSEGERKRTQIARALMTDPELLLLDEPGAGLDLGGREDLVRRLTDLARDHYAPAQVLVTHHVEEIPPGYTHALLLNEGEVLAAGAVRDVLTAPLLSETFGLPLQVQWDDGRVTARRRA